jgi:hypothetical protein
MHNSYNIIGETLFMKELYSDFMYFLYRTRRVEMAATECKTLEGCYADVCSVETKGVYEYELKASMNDIHNEKHKPKHKIYAQFDKFKRSLPQYFSFVIPAEIESQVMALIDDGHFNKKYGIVTYTGKLFKFVKQPHRLNTGNSGYIRQEIIRRQIHDFSELVKLQGELSERLTELSDVVEQQREEILRLDPHGSKDPDKMLLDSIALGQVKQIVDDWEATPLERVAAIEKVLKS